MDSSLLTFNVAKISAALHVERDTRFTYMGLQTVYDRYLIHDKGTRLETPQYFWMRVAMGLAVLETADQKNERAIEFYELLSPRSGSRRPRRRCLTPARCTRSFRRAT